MIEKSVIIYCAIMVITGTTNTIFNNYMSSEKYYNYYHGFFTSYLMFIGESFPLFYLLFKLLYNKIYRDKYFKDIINDSYKNEKNTQVSNWKIGLGSCFDCIGSTFISFSLIYLDPSINVIGRGGIIILVALYSYFLLNKRYNRNQILGLIVLFIGIGIVFLSTILNKNAASNNQDNSNSKNSMNNLIISIIFLVLSWIIQGFQMVYQEKMFDKYEIDTFRYIGLEGIYGIIFSTIILFATGIINCPENANFCIPGHKIDNPSSALTEFLTNKGLLFFSALFIISISIYNFVGLIVTQRISSLFRMILDNVRSITVWIYGLITGAEEWQKYSYLQVIGFLIFIFGSAIYQELLFKKNKKNSSNLKSSKINSFSYYTK